MRQLLFMADWPECEPLLWFASGALFWSAPLSDELKDRVANWAQEYYDGCASRDEDQWIDAARHATWLSTGWELLADLNRFLLSRGFLVWPGPDFDPAGILVSDAPKEGAGQPDRISANRVVEVVSAINNELRGRGIEPIEPPEMTDL